MVAHTKTGKSQPAADAAGVRRSARFQKTPGQSTGPRGSRASIPPERELALKRLKALESDAAGRAVLDPWAGSDGERSGDDDPPDGGTRAKRGGKAAWEGRERRRRFRRKVLDELLHEEQDHDDKRLTFLSAEAEVSSRPPRRLCEVCWCLGRYKCPACGGKYCSVACGKTHHQALCPAVPVAQRSLAMTVA